MPRHAKTPAPSPDLLPQFDGWFSARGWQPRAHQIAFWQAARAGHDALLIAPTGGGKTLAGFMPSLEDLVTNGGRGKLHTLYMSPLKALAVDIQRNLMQPVEELGLDMRIETRSGDTPQNRKTRQKQNPPDILLTTPEQLALMLSWPEAADYFAALDTIIIDELHALAPNKRGDLLALGLARLATLAPKAKRLGLSATVADKDALRRFLTPQSDGDETAKLIEGTAGAPPSLSILDTKERLPWGSHTARHAMGDVLAAIKNADTSLVFVNTRSQAEMVFRELWALNEGGLEIALHHGSLAPERRRKVEAAMAAGQLRAVVCTSTLDLGIDWGAVDLVIHVGAPKGASRLAQRIGRANHRFDEASAALLVPSNRFEVLECKAARESVAAGEQDGAMMRTGGLDVLAQHIFGTACHAPFDPLALYQEVCRAAPYHDLPRPVFDRVVDFVATGGYALQTYDRYARLRQEKDGRYRLAHPRLATRYRMNVGTIVEAPMLKVRLTRPQKGKRPIRGGRVLGEMEEYFLTALAPGDTFVFAGETLRLEAVRDTEALVSRASHADPKVPTYQGGKFPISTHLAERVRAMLSTPETWDDLPPQVAQWLKMQQAFSALPDKDVLLVESFARGARYYMTAYPFEGRLAHQTLGMLLTRRLERMGGRPMGFVANDYGLAVWGLRDIGLMVEQEKLTLAALFAEDMLGDDLEAWLDESSLMKRTFRDCAMISGLIEKNLPGHEKTGRQVLFSADLIFDVLRSHEPDHILLQAARADAATGLLDIGRLGQMLARIQGKLLLKRLDHISPLAVPLLMEMGKEPVRGAADDELLGEAASTRHDDLVREATQGISGFGHADAV
ncbi:MAG: ligase-associated DNA damage response DEXH box helicase [PS1 clade bacterium]|uniref:Ligase-associated DNA damage response DEXH box helicase n=1 Tax=PS1 clade bacterium TaxID=2175152 RepID=A0A937HNP7_9PROT|nr:ligase-associated DNA damage response DEXH box helicase [PS1 clade bacterium]